MISQNGLRKLFTRSEDKTIDFKRGPYSLKDDQNKSWFIKDILAMANTPRDQTSYIIIGVYAHQDGMKDLIGVKHHPDDNDLQQVLDIAKVQIEPRPEFVYYPMSLDGVSYGVIEIPIQKSGPYFPKKDFGALTANRLYFRKGSKNTEARTDEQKDIYRWFQLLEGKIDSPKLSLEEKEFNIPNWSEFYQACHYFNSDHLYLLIIGPNNQISPELLQSLARLPISMILDFDPMTEEGGVYSSVKAEFEKHRSVYLLTRDDKYALSPEKACYWYAVRGLHGRESSSVEEDWRQWNRKYGRVMRNWLIDLKKASGGKPLTVVNLWYGLEYVRTICTTVDETFGDSADYLFVIPDADRYTELTEQFSGKAISMQLSDVLHGIAHNVSKIDGGSLPAGIPKLDGTIHVIPRSILNWLSIDFDVLHSSIMEDGSEDNEYHFLQGAMSTWDDLENHYDADRDDKPKLQKLIERELEQRISTRLNLYHWPGAGGTTLARRIAWDLRYNYPVVILKKITLGETIDRLQEIFRATENSILVIVEGADVLSDHLDALYNEVRVQQTPIVFLSVIRRTSLPKQNRERSMYLGKTLSNTESYRFAQTFKRLVPEKSKQLEKIIQLNAKDRTPFLFAFTAFGRDFIGLTSYVEFRLETATSIQRQIITFLALAYYYGHKPVLPHIFATHLGQPENYLLRLEKILDEIHLDLLIQEEGSKWRPAHHLIAEEILIIVLSGNSPERRNWKRLGLTAWAIDFIRACSKGGTTPPDDLIDLLHRIFILRDERELLGTEDSYSTNFSQLIEDIPSREGRLSIFKELVEVFPYEAHFWGHLGRYYSMEMEEHENAIEAIDKALTLSDERDSVLCHMKGMSYRKIAFNHMHTLENNKETLKAEQLGILRESVEKAKEAFSKAREFAPDSEHPYISPIQLLLRLLDFGYKTSNSKSRSEFLALPSATWYREQLDEIEDLMERLRSTRAGDKPSGYEARCQADLNDIYDNYERALEGWNNLLSRRDVYAPPVRRQIVRAYLSRRGRDWNAIPLKEIERIVDLMEENLREEPASDHNIRIWFRAVRYSSRQNIDLALDRLTNWKAIEDSQEAYYYLYVLHALKAIKGSTIEQVRTIELVRQSAEKSRNQRNRTRSFEWMGEGDEMRCLVHQSELGEWNEEEGFFNHTSKLVRVEGRITNIKGPEGGTIELLSCGLPAFFVPARARIKDKEAGATKANINLKVSFFLGFSYDGLRAWSVEEI